jgi:cellulose synthase/poly-beta-1,6-N-acetylglucosamine synthase-like glycosyltransferase
LNAPPPVVSVVVPCFNQARFLDVALECLVAQTCSAWEALVIDDGSTDESPAVARQWAERDSRVIVLRSSTAASPRLGTGGSAKRADASAILVLAARTLHAEPPSEPGR